MTAPLAFALLVCAFVLATAGAALVRWSDRPPCIRPAGRKITMPYCKRCGHRTMATIGVHTSVARCRALLMRDLRARSKAMVAVLSRLDALGK